VERSGETDRIKMRGSGRTRTSSDAPVVVGEVFMTRLISFFGLATSRTQRISNSQHRDFVRAPTKAHGSGEQVS
jgi:hypothetical protein